jgi:hypothetical protein
VKDGSKNKRIKDILGYLQEDIPDAQMNPDVEEDDEDEADVPVPIAGSYTKKKLRPRV